jgi:uncharacterized spore protein YtfJ
MSTTTDGVTARRTGDQVLSALAEQIGARFGAASVFGEPIERDGVTVVPVASVRLAGGGGAGADPGKRQEGEGAGGVGTMTAAGYIELKDGRTRFVPVVNPARMLALMCLTALAALAIVRPAATPRRRRR